MKIYDVFLFGYELDLSAGKVDSPDSRENIKKPTTKAGSNFAK